MDVNVNGVRMMVRERGEGDGQTLLLVHGFPLDSRMWREQLSGLARYTRVIAPDLRGHGLSDASQRPSSMDQHADDLAALLDRLDVKKAIVAGLSMGGYVTLALWRRHPERVAGIALVDTRAEPDTPAGKANRDVTAAWVREAGAGLLADEMMPKLLAPQSLADERITTQLREMIQSQPVEGLIGALGAMRDRIDSAATLATITVPTLVIVGDADAITPPADAAAMAARIPRRAVGRDPPCGTLEPVGEPSRGESGLGGIDGESRGHLTGSGKPVRPLITLSRTEGEAHGQCL